MTTTGLVLRPTGDLDEEGCAALRRELATAMAAGLQHLVIDLTGVTDLGVEAIRLLRGVETFLQRREGGLVLVHASDLVRRRLRVNELDHLLQVRDRTFLEPLPAPAPATRDQLPAVVPLASRRSAG